MNCPKCGFEIKKRNNFCPYCGENLKDSVEAEIIDKYYKDEPMHNFYIGEIIKVYE